MLYRQNLVQSPSRSAHTQSRRAPPERAKPLPRELPRMPLYQSSGKVRHAAACSRGQTTLPRSSGAAAYFSPAPRQVRHELTNRTRACADRHGCAAPRCSAQLWACLNPHICTSWSSHGNVRDWEARHPYPPELWNSEQFAALSWRNTKSC